MSDKMRSIGTLWVEGPLSFLEQVCLLSLQAAGHGVTLFHYGEVTNVPDGIEVVNAREIHDPAKIIYNKQFNTPVAQSDIFRLHMMQQTDLIWADTDMLCLKPFDTGQSHIFGYFRHDRLCNAVMRIPKDSPGLAAYLDHAKDEYPIAPYLPAGERAALEALKKEGKHKHVSEQGHAAYGPQVFTWFMEQSGEISHAAPLKTFYPVPFKHAGEISDLHARNLRETYFDETTRGVHLWARRFRWWVDNRGFARHSLLDRKLRVLGIDPQRAPIIRKSKQAKEPIIFPSDLPQRQTPNEAVQAATPIPISTRVLRNMDPYMAVAETTLATVRAQGVYGVHDPPPQDTWRGYDHYDTEAARVFALARSVHRYTYNHRTLPDLLNPQTVTEKLLVMKMFGAIPNKAHADKLLAEQAVPSDVAKHLTPVKRFWQSSKPELPANDDIPPGDYWLKGNFGQGNNRRISFPLSDDERATHQETLSNWAEQGFHGFWAAEWWYADIKRQYFIEENLGAVDADITDWKFWTVAGRVQLVQVDRDRSSGHVQLIYDRNFKFIPEELYYKTSDQPEKKPKNFANMVKLAEGIARDLEFARVDLYNIDGRIMLGEITLCPFGGKRKMRTPKLDTDLGAAWTGTRLFPKQAGQ